MASSRMKYISPGSWFSLEYPADWCEFEDTEGSFLFYNPDKWTGNFRISACRGADGGYAKACMDAEVQQSPGAKRVKVGAWDCVYLAESFQEGGEWYTSHIWVTGKKDVSVECSFTVPKGEGAGVAEEIIATLDVRGAGGKPFKEVIPVRVLEVNVINEAYDWAVSAIKKLLTRDFTAVAADVESIQKAVDSGRFRRDQRDVWESFGIVFGTILVNEMDGMEWVTVIDGPKEYPALRFRGTDVMVYPQRLIWDKVRKGETCDLKAEYLRICSAVEEAL